MCHLVEMLQNIVELNDIFMLERVQGS
jgi:hypothetical protein